MASPQRVAGEARRRAALLLLALATAALGGGCGPSAAPVPQSGEQASGAPSSATSAAEAELASDPRLAYLLAPCARSDHYDVDTSDVGAMLVTMLLRGDRDALRRARDELAARGDEGLAAVGRVVDTYLADPDGYGHLRNAVDVCHRSDAPGARAILLRTLDSSFEGVAVQAVVALGKHGVPADLDKVIGVLERVSPESQVKVATAMHAIDPRRASLIYLDWIDAGLVEGHWDTFAQFISTSLDADVARRAKDASAAVPPRFRPLLLAPAARAGDEQALEFLRAEAKAPEVWRRELSIAALSAAGKPEELTALALGDPVTEVRMRAINALSPTSPELVEALRAGALSPDPTLSTTCLNVLIRKGDSTAVDRALEMLADGTPELLGLAMGALEPLLAVDPAVAARALEILSRRFVSESGAALAERVSILESIARIPLADSARLLREQAAREQGSIKGLPARRWLLRLVGNVGEPGQRLAAAELASVRDPALRLDLLEALSLRATPFAKGELLRLAEGGSLSAHELLFVAERLTLVATVAEGAPVLKRATLRVQHPDVRRALQCLMWRCYPGPR